MDKDEYDENSDDTEEDDEIGDDTEEDDKIGGDTVSKDKEEWTISWWWSSWPCMLVPGTPPAQTQDSSYQNYR